MKCELIQKQKAYCRSLIIFLFPFSLILSQNKVDTLLEQIKQKPDTTKIRLLNNFCWTYRNKEFQLALESGKEALKISEKIKSKKFQAESLNLMGVIYRDLGKYDKSLSLYMRALQLAQEAKDDRQIAYSYNNIGGIYRLESNYPLAIEYILKGLKKFEERNDKEGAAFCNINIGLVYSRQHNYEKALEYYKISYDLRKELGDNIGKATSLSHIAEIHSEVGNYNEALINYFILEKEYLKLDDKKGQISVWSGIAAVYELQKEFTKALKYRQKALDLSISFKNIEGQITNHSNIAILYARVGQFAIGEQHLRIALDYSSTIKSPYLRLSCYKASAQFYGLKSDYKNAFLYSQQYAALKDSTINQENSSQIAEMEAVYKTSKNEKENALLQKDLEISERQRNFVFLIALLVVIIAFITYNRYHSKKVANKKLQELNALKDKFFGIIAHDLKNPFAAIFGFTNILLHEFESLGDDEKKRLISSIDDSGRQTYKLLENLLYWSRSQTGGMDFNPKLLNLNEIIIEAFFVLESSAKFKKITLYYDAADNMTAFGDENMIKTVLRNLISNGIKFTTQRGKVSVHLKSEITHVKITVEDTGIGISKEIQERLFQIDNVSTSEGTNGEKGTGLGLILCKEFVEKNGGKIWAESEIGKGSKFIFTIPTKNY